MIPIGRGEAYRRGHTVLQLVDMQHGQADMAVATDLSPEEICKRHRTLY